jgi:DNA-binding transcriptional regulator GbsR (MarR family)
MVVILHASIPPFFETVGNSIQTSAAVSSRSLTKGGSLGNHKAISKLDSEYERLNPFQRESIALFINASVALSLPRSIGEIYGLLFSTEEPLSLDDVVERLQISKGSASEGLRWLKSLGAVNLVYVPGVRREHFTAETSLRKLASGYLRDRIDPHLENGQERLRALESSIGGNGAADFQRGRLGQVRGWYQFISKVLPIVKTLAGKF